MPRIFAPIRAMVGRTPWSAAGPPRPAFDACTTLIPFGEQRVQGVRPTSGAEFRFWEKVLGITLMVAVRLETAKPRLSGSVRIFSWPQMIKAVLCFALAAAATPEDRAIGFLAREVPRWKQENGCYSCHNNGDAARALYRARMFAAAADTTAWLTRPRQWQENRGDSRFSNKPLVQIQFASALQEALQSGATDNRQALIQAAADLLPHQSAAGSWPVDADSNPGSPVTYGAMLATYIARQTLSAADPERFRAPIERANAWLRKQEPRSTPDAVALILALNSPSALAVLKRAQSSDGGFGPYASAPADPFDTAIAILALKAVGGQTVEIRRARLWLTGAQQPDGSWVETTRPAGSQSYAQRMSTSAWAAIALLETR